MVLLSPLLKRMDQRLAFLLFLFVIASAWLLVWMTGLRPTRTPRWGASSSL